MRLTWLADALRAAGLDVVEVDGWQNRGRDLGSVQGVVWHHTATGPRTSDASVARLLVNGRPDLPGPLCQLGLDRAGRYHVIAAGKGNHNGHGTWGNQAIGIEAYNDGVGEPWPAAQVDAYVAGTRALLDHLGLDVDLVLGHKETDPSRKIDPRGLDMHEMRTRIATPQGEEDVSEIIGHLFNLAVYLDRRFKESMEAQWRTRRLVRLVGKKTGLTDAEMDAELAKPIGSTEATEIGPSLEEQLQDLAAAADAA